MDIESILRQLANERSVFHSEADFQHALAWKIHEIHPLASIRLEVPSKRDDKREHIDVVVSLEDKTYALELKYKKRRFVANLNGEKFDLRSDGAQDISRYDFIKDIDRLERYVSLQSGAIGYAVMLTNDDLYWRESSRGINSAAFFLNEGRTLDGGTPLAWHERTGDGTKKGRADSFNLRNSYKIIWRDYSPQSGERTKFRYLLLTIQQSASSPSA